MVSVIMEPGRVCDIEMLTSHRCASEVCKFATVGQEGIRSVFYTFLVKLLLPGSVLSNRNIMGATCHLKFPVSHIKISKKKQGQ